MLGIPMSVEPSPPQGTQKLWPPQPRRQEVGSPPSPSMTSEDSSFLGAHLHRKESFQPQRGGQCWGSHSRSWRYTPGGAPHKVLRGGNASLSGSFYL